MSVGIRTGDNNMWSGTTSGAVEYRSKGSQVNPTACTFRSPTAIALFGQGAHWFIKQSTRLYDLNLNYDRNISVS